MSTYQLLLVTAIAAAIAAVASAISLLIAWLSLREGGESIKKLAEVSAAARSTLEAQNATLEAQKAILASANLEAGHIQQAAEILGRILSEERVARDLAALRSIASTVEDMKMVFRRSQELPARESWPLIDQGLGLLRAQLGAWPDEDLPKCRYLLDHADPRLSSAASDVQNAAEEIRLAIVQAGKRLASPPDQTWSA